LLAARVVVAMMVGPSSSGIEGRGTLIQEGPPLVFFAGILLVCAWCC
jgi:hypothetical protein